MKTHKEYLKEISLEDYLAEEEQNNFDFSTIDIETREHFNVMDFGFHCETEYYLPYPEQVELALKKSGYQDIDELCDDMWRYYTKQYKQMLEDAEIEWKEAQEKGNESKTFSLSDIDDRIKNYLSDNGISYERELCCNGYYYRLNKSHILADEYHPDFYNYRQFEYRVIYRIEREPYENCWEDDETVVTVEELCDVDKVLRKVSDYATNKYK